MFSNRRRNILYDCNLQVVFLAFFWIVFIAVGAFVSADDVIVNTLVRKLPTTKMTLLGRLTSILIPYTLFLSGLLSGKRYVSLLVFLLNAFGTGYTLRSTVSFYRSAGWLMQLLLLFSGTVANCVLVWVPVCGVCSSKSLVKIGLVGFVVIILSVLIDYLLISPFLALLSI